jgi:hypothetical protein
MADKLVNANLQSEVLKKMYAQDGVIPMAKPIATAPPMGIAFNKLPPYIAIGSAVPIANNSMTIKETNSGMLFYSSYGFVYNYTVAVGDIAQAPVAFNVLRSMEVLSNGNLIVYKTGEALLAQVKKMKDIDRQTRILRDASMLNPLTEKIVVPADTPATFLTYLPDLQTFLDDEEQQLYLSVIGDIQVRFTFHDNVRSGLTNAISGVASAFKYSNTWTSAPAVMDKIREKDWSERKSRMIMNTDTEQVALDTVTTVVGHVFTTSFMVESSTFMIKQTTGTAGCPLFRINTINSLKINGQELLNDYKASRIRDVGSKMGQKSFDTTGVDGAITMKEGVLTINWKAFAELSGGAFFQQLRGSSISLTFDTVTTSTDAHLFICHDYLQMVDYVPDGNSSGSNGYLIVSQSS